MCAARGQQGELDDLRRHIDRLDHRVLALLAERFEVVAQVAAVKRQAGTAIRDLDRERWLLSDRRAVADGMGLPADMAETLFRRVLLTSRDAQAQLKVEVPDDLGGKVVAVIGGHGAMGRRLVSLFEGFGNRVVVSDVNTALGNVEAARQSDVVVVSVPIDVTESVVGEVAPVVRPDALLMDVTSLKSFVMDAMMDRCQGSVVGTHPMFGPGVRTLTGQRVVLCRGRGDGWYEWVHRVFTGRGLLVTQSDAREHDRMMGIVQVLNHFHTQVLGVALSRLGVPMERSLAFTSPVYLLEAYVTGRHFAQAPELYGEIEMRNPDRARITAAFREAAQEVADLVERRDREGFVSMFERVRSFFGDFTREAQEQSRFLVDQMVELTSGRVPRGVASEGAEEGPVA